MKRRDFISGLVATASLAGPALAQDYVSSVIAQLKGMGFREIRQERTLLGRVRILGVRDDGRREIIINPTNGEILRDLWSPFKGSKDTTALIDDKSGPGGGGSGSGGGGDDDGGDDDGEDGEGGGGDDDDGGDDGEGGGGDDSDSEDGGSDDSGDDDSGGDDDDED